MVDIVLSPYTWLVLLGLQALTLSTIIVVFLAKQLNEGEPHVRS